MILIPVLILQSTAAGAIVIILNEQKEFSRVVKPDFPIVIRESLCLLWNRERATHKNTFHPSGADPVQPGLGGGAAAEVSAGRTTCQNSSPSRRWVDVTAAEQKGFQAARNCFSEAAAIFARYSAFLLPHFPCIKAAVLLI